MTKEYEIKLRDLLQNFCDELLPYLDCDGCTRLISVFLDSKKIEHEIYTGAIRFGYKSFPLHYWIKTKNGTIFDFKSEKWIGVKSDKVEYIGEVQVSKEGFMLPLKDNKSLIIGILIEGGMNNYDGKIIGYKK